MLIFSKIVKLCVHCDPAGRSGRSAVKMNNRKDAKFAEEINKY